jgi:hypothetical protein
MKVPQTDRYKSVSLKTADIDAAKERAFDQDSDLRFRIKHEVPIFNRPFSRKLPARWKDFANLQKERVEAGEITWKRWELVDSTIRVNLSERHKSTSSAKTNGRATAFGGRGHSAKNASAELRRGTRRSATARCIYITHRRKDPRSLLERVSDATIRCRYEWSDIILIYPTFCIILLP